MSPSSQLETLFVGATATPPTAVRRVDGLVAFRRSCGEGLDDGEGPPGALLRAVWGYFATGGGRAVIASTGRAAGPGDPAQLAETVRDALRFSVSPLVVLPGPGRDAAALLDLAAALTRAVPWPDPGPWVLLDAPARLARDFPALIELAAELRARSGGRCQLVTPPPLGTPPVQGPARPGAISPAALAAGLIGAGGLARIAGRGLAFAPPPPEVVQQQLVEAGVALLVPGGGGYLAGRGLPRWPGAAAHPDPDEQRLGLDASPLGPLVRQLTDSLAHHAHQPWDAGLGRRIERDALAALGRFFGRAGQRGYAVRCDDELNPPEQRGSGEVIVELVLSPPLPVVRQVVLRLTVRAGE